MATNARVLVLDNISEGSAEMGLIGLTRADLPAPGMDQQIVNLRMRLETNVDDPNGQFLVTVRWSDGGADQEWNVSTFVNDPLHYIEQPQQIWCDASRNVTAQVSALVPGGSIDVLILGEF